MSDSTPGRISRALTARALRAGAPGGKATGRRVGVAVALAVALTAGGLAGCARGDASAGGTDGPKLAADAELPTEVPAGTKLTIGDPKTQTALELSGQIDQLGADIEWANISGGPETQEAFRAKALDVGAVADIPPIHAAWTGLDTRIVASSYRKQPLRTPIYRIGIAPGANIDSLADLRGKRVAYSPGQAQGALVLRVLDKVGLTKDDIRPVELPSVGDAYVTALASGQVDAAPLGETNIKRYENDYAKDGGKLLPHGLRDDQWHLYASTDALRDPAKAAAIREYVQAWGRAQRWIYEHPEQWAEGYYMATEGLDRADAEFMVASAGEPVVPRDWDELLKRHQQTIDLLAEQEGRERLKAADLYDLRYESIAADAIQASDSEAGEPEAGDAQAGDSEAGDSEAGERK